MIKTREQSIYDEIFKISKSLGFRTFDYIPPDETQYPFVQIEDTHTVHIPNKTDIKGFVVLNVSVWGNRKQRKLISDMASQIYEKALRLEHTDGYFWSLNIAASDIQLLDDTSTVEPLKRVRLTLEFNLR